MARRKQVWINKDADIIVSQYQNKSGLFCVAYGLQVDDNLTYSQACKSIGEALLHHLACEGIVNNDGEL